MICAILVYFGTPLIYYDTPISSSYRVEGLRPPFEYYSNESTTVLNKFYNSIYRVVDPDFGLPHLQRIDLNETFQTFDIQLLYGYN